MLAVLASSKTCNARPGQVTDDFDNGAMAGLARERSRPMLFLTSKTDEMKIGNIGRDGVMESWGTILTGGLYVKH
jgi:hypothetical protein